LWSGSLMIGWLIVLGCWVSPNFWALPYFIIPKRKKEQFMFVGWSIYCIAMVVDACTKSVDLNPNPPCWDLPQSHQTQPGAHHQVLLIVAQELCLVWMV
jgi:hypothetical protein